MSTEVLTPSSTISNSLVIFGGGTAHEALDDGMGGGDSTGVKEDTGFADSCLVHLSDPTGTPNKTVNWTLKARMRHVGDAPNNKDIILREGGTTRATLTPTTTTSWATYTLSFDPTVITGNSTDLRIEIELAAAIGGGNEVQVADVELLIDNTTSGAAAGTLLPLIGVG